MTTRNPDAVLVRALDQAAEVLDHVGPDLLDRSTPCTEWTVAELVDHLIQDPRNFRTMLVGREPDWSRPPPHVSEAWGAAFRAAADELVDTWRTLEGEPPHPPQWECAEIAVHTWDLAVALGRPVSELDPAVAEAGLGFMTRALEPGTRGTAFGPEQPAPDGAGPYERLAAFSGRRVG